MSHWHPGRDEARQLAKAGYDGLYSPDGECACLVGDLYPCGERQDDCEPGYKVPCPGATCYLGGDCDWHVAPTKGQS